MGTKLPCGGCTPKPPCCKVCCLKGPSPLSRQKILCLAPMPGKNGLQDQEKPKSCRHKKPESSSNLGVKKCPDCGKEISEDSPCDCGHTDKSVAKEDICEKQKDKKKVVGKKSSETMEEICGKKSPEIDETKSKQEICEEYESKIRCKIYVRPRSRELRGGVHYTHCDCGKLNGLQHDCRRSECQGCPECIVYPPKCINSPYTNAKHLTEIADAKLEKMRCPEKVV